MADRLRVGGANELRLFLKGIAVGAKPSIANTINRGITRAKKETIDEVVKELNITKKEIRASFKFKRASSQNLNGSLSTRGRPLSLMLEPITRFSARKRKGGYSYVIKRKRGRVYIPGSFKLDLKSGYSLSFVRNKNNKLKAMYTTRIPDIVENEDSFEKISRETNDFMVKELQEQIIKQLQKMK